MKKQIFTLLTLLLCVSSGAWATVFTFDVSTDFNSLTNVQKDAIIANGIFSGDDLISIKFSNPGTDFQRDANGIKMRGGSGRNATITISGSIVAKISKVALTYYDTKRNIVSTPSVSRTDDDPNKTMTWSFDNVGNLTLSQNVGNTVLTKIEVTYSATDITATTAVWDFVNCNPASISTDVVNIQGKEADVASSVASISMHVSAIANVPYDGSTGKLNYRSDDGDAQCNKGTVIQIPVKGTLDVVTIVPRSGAYIIAGGSEVSATTSYVATAADVAQGYVEIVCSSNGYLYSLKVVQYSCQTTIGTTGWSTFSCSQALDLANATPADPSSDALKAYMITGFAGTAINKSEALNNAPKETGLLLNGTIGETYTIPVMESSSTTTSSNKLVAAVDGTTVNAGEAPMVNYVLMNDGAGNAEFQWIGTTAATLGANKAYLALNGGPTSARGIWFEEDEATGIKAIENGQLTISNSCFDLQGRRVAQPTKGLYIVNGKKVIIK